MITAKSQSFTPAYPWGGEDRDSGESNSIQNQEGICQGGFHPSEIPR